MLKTRSILNYFAVKDGKNLCHCLFKFDKGSMWLLSFPNTLTTRCLAWASLVAVAYTVHDVIQKWHRLSVVWSWHMLVQLLITQSYPTRMFWYLQKTFKSSSQMCSPNFINFPWTWMTLAASEVKICSEYKSGIFFTKHDFCIPPPFPS